MIGFFGGSFDPFHNAHRALAEAAVRELALDSLVVMPTSNPPHRTPLFFSSDERLTLATAGLAGLPRVEVSDFEAHGTTPQYTYETLQALSAQRGRRDWVVCLGADAFLYLNQWHRAEELMAQYPVAVAPRVGIDQDHVVEVANHWERSRGLKVIWLKTTLPQVSATVVRKCLESGQIPENLLPPEVTARLKSMGPRVKTDN